MKEKILKLFFKEEEILISDEPTDLKTATELIKNEKIKDDYKLSKKILNIITIILSILIFGNLIIESVYPTGPFNYRYIHDVCFFIFLIITSYMIVDNFYIKKIIKYLNKKSLKGIKKYFVKLLIITLLGIHNICFELYYILNLEKNTYLVCTIITVITFILTIKTGINLLNKLFQKIEELKNEMEGIV